MSKIVPLPINSCRLRDPLAVIKPLTLVEAVKAGIVYRCWCNRTIASQYGRPTLQGAIRHDYCDHCGRGAIEFDPPTTAQIADMIDKHLL